MKHLRVLTGFLAALTAVMFLFCGDNVIQVPDGGTDGNNAGGSPTGAAPIVRRLDGAGVRTSATEALLRFQSDKSGTAYYLALDAAGAVTAPTGDAVKASGKKLAGSVAKDKEENRTITVDANAKSLNVFLAVEGSNGVISTPILIVVGRYVEAAEKITRISQTPSGQYTGIALNQSKSAAQTAILPITDKSLQVVINAIKEYANGRSVKIYFGERDETFDVGTSPIRFENAGWNEITIVGNIKGNVATEPKSVVYVGDGVTVNFVAYDPAAWEPYYIENTADAGYGVYLASGSSFNAQWASANQIKGATAAFYLVQGAALGGAGDFYNANEVDGYNPDVSLVTPAGLALIHSSKTWGIVLNSDGTVTQLDHAPWGEDVVVTGTATWTSVTGRSLKITGLARGKTIPNNSGYTLSYDTFGNLELTVGTEIFTSEILNIVTSLGTEPTITISDVERIDAHEIRIGNVTVSAPSSVNGVLEWTFVTPTTLTSATWTKIVGSDKEGGSFDIDDPGLAFVASDTRRLFLRFTTNNGWSKSTTAGEELLETIEVPLLTVATTVTRLAGADAEKVKFKFNSDKQGTAYYLSVPPDDGVPDLADFEVNGVAAKAVTANSPLEIDDFQVGRDAATVYLIVKTSATPRKTSKLLSLGSVAALDDGGNEGSAVVDILTVATPERAATNKHNVDVKITSPSSGTLFFMVSDNPDLGASENGEVPTDLDPTHNDFAALFATGHSMPITKTIATTLSLTGVVSANINNDPKNILAGTDYYLYAVVLGSASDEFSELKKIEIPKHEPVLTIDPQGFPRDGLVQTVKAKLDNVEYSGNLYAFVVDDDDPDATLPDVSKISTDWVGGVVNTGEYTFDYHDTDLDESGNLVTSGNYTISFVAVDAFDVLSSIATNTQEFEAPEISSATLNFRLGATSASVAVIASERLTNVKYAVETKGGAAPGTINETPSTVDAKGKLDGTWEYSFDIRVSTGAKDVYFLLEDLAGNVSEISSSPDVEIDAEPAEVAVGNSSGDKVRYGKDAFEAVLSHTILTTVYYDVVASGGTAPAGNAVVTKNQTLTVSETGAEKTVGLPDGDAYDVYYVVVSGSGTNPRYYSDPVKVEVGAALDITLEDVDVKNETASGNEDGAITLKFATGTSGDIFCHTTNSGWAGIESSGFTGTITSGEFEIGSLSAGPYTYWFFVVKTNNGIDYYSEIRSTGPRTVGSDS